MIENKYISNTMRTLATSTHALTEREKDDFYATEPKAIELLLEKESFNKNIWECANGKGHLSNVLMNNGYNVFKSDIVNRNEDKETKIIDFLKTNERPFRDSFDIITNPPYKIALYFCKKGLSLLKNGEKMAMFLKIQFLEGQERYKFFKENPPKKIYVASKRLNCAKNGDFKKYKSSAVCYAWFVWEKGFIGSPEIDWIIY